MHITKPLFKTCNHVLCSFFHGLPLRADCGLHCSVNIKVSTTEVVWKLLLMYESMAFMTNSHEKNHADNTKWKSESPKRWNNILTHYKEQAASQEVKPDLTVNTSCDLEKCMLLHYADLSYGNWMHCWCNVSEPLLFISLCIILIFNNIHSRPVFLEIPSFCPTARIGEFCH